MSEANVRGIIINYEVIGTQGPWIALTPGSRRNFSEFVGLGKVLAQGGTRVLLHDRRNCGGSEVGIEDIGSENEIWADDLYELGRQLGAKSLYVGGASAGARLAILFALRHPDALRGLTLWRVTGGAHAAETLAESYYGSFMKVAEKGGMAAVCETDHFKGVIGSRPGNRDRLMAMDPKEFIRIMGAWRDDFLTSAAKPVVGATEEQLRAIAAPACLIAGNDVIHAPKAARNLARILSESEFHDDVVSKRDDNNLLEVWDQKEWKTKEDVIARTLLDFIGRHEARRAA
jgi:pimeloyl-ACP methyl ester carboxylesterase